MEASRTTGIILLSLALVLGTVSMFMETGEAFVKTTSDLGESTYTEEYSFWALGTEIDPFTGDQVESSDGWYDSAFDGTGGITFLRLAPIALTVGLVFVAVALLLTIVPRTGQGISGGVLAAIGFVDILAAGLLHGTGATLRATQEFGRPDAIIAQWNAYLYAFVALLVLAAGLVGMRRGHVHRHEEDHQWDEAFASSIDEEGLQHLMCPDCHHIERAPFGSVPQCSNCGFSSRQTA